MWKPPSALRTVPVPKSKSPLAAAITQLATSSGVPQRLIGVIPSAISLSYLAETTSVIGVLIIPGYGPGVLDCKGGVVASFLAMDALDRCGFRARPVMHILQTDEETGSKTSGKDTVRYMCEKAKGSVAFLNTEANREGFVVLSRKGILRYEFTVHGISAHSSLCVSGANAIAEAAYKIIELEKMKDKDGLTCNCGVISGGSVANTVAETCRFTADIRFANAEQLEWAKNKIREVSESSTVDGCTCDVRQVSMRPAMERLEANEHLAARINEINGTVGLPAIVSRVGEGGSDAAYTTQAGIPSVDAIGVEGGRIHSPEEYAVKSSLALSAKQQAAVVCFI